MKTSALCLLLSAGLFSGLQAQENLGFSNDQYSGISSVGISPTQSFLNPNPWDVNLFAEDIFLQNDYIYVSKQRGFGLIKGNLLARDASKGITGETTNNVVDFFNGNHLNYHLSNEILGPSFSFKQTIAKKVFYLGVFSKLRTQGSAKDLDNYFQSYNQDLPYPSDYSLKPVKTNFMNWNEFGFNASTQVFEESNFQWILGANIKYEMGLDAAVVNSKSPIKLTANNIVVKSDDIVADIYASNYNIEADYASNYNFDKNTYRYTNKGRGLGLDVGLSMVDRDKKGYNFKISANILDFGSVKYKGEKHIFQGDPVQVGNSSAFDNSTINGPHDFLQLLSKEVYGDPNASLEGNKFSVGLPTSFHLNLSKRIVDNQYLSLDWIQRTPIFENSLKRNNILNLNYSVQKEWFGFGASTSLYEYKTLQLGGYLRLGPLILGSENALPLVFKQKKLHSGDFYIALKVYPFWDTPERRRLREKCDCEK